MLNRISDFLSGPGRVTIPRRLVGVVLALIFCLAFVVSPYWSLMPTSAGQVSVLIILLVLGGAWSYFSASDVELHDVPRAAVWAIILFVLIGLLNARALTSVIPWRGDESTFITRTRDLIDRVPLVEFAFMKLLLLAVLVAVALRSRLFTMVAVTLEAAAVAWFLARAPFDGVGATVMIRWPYLDYWLFSGPPMLATYVWDWNHEFLYRLLPLASAAGAAWAVHRRLTGMQPLARLLWALACATIPLVIYYSSVLYIDVSAMFLMVIVYLTIETMLDAEPAQVRRQPAWLALILLGFLKDTVVIFLLCYLLVRWMVRILGALRSAAARAPRSDPRPLLGEARLAFSVLAPSVIYLAFRLYLINIRSYTRGYSPDLQRLLDPEFYRITLQALVDQFGLFLVLFLAGLLLLMLRRRYPQALFIALLFIAVPVFFGVDRSSAGLYGYSRFNLFVLPAVLAASITALDRIARWGRLAPVAFAMLAIAENLVASPVNGDGTKQPFWGNYQIDVGEHYYPYDEALLWLKENHPVQRVLFSPTYYRYYLSFYFAKYEYHPEYDILITDENADDQQSLMESLSKAERDGFEEVLLQVKGPDAPSVPPGAAFCLQKTFRNQAHTLLLYGPSGTCPGN